MARAHFWGGGGRGNKKTDGRKKTQQRNARTEPAPANQQRTKHRDHTTKNRQHQTTHLILIFDIA